MQSKTTFELQSLNSDTPFARAPDPEKKIDNASYRLHGWRSGALSFALCSTVVFVINLILTIWSSATRPTTDGLLYEGDCDYSKRLNTGMHVMINVFSTVLLSGSNYCMQCMSAPTREEVDTAHANNKWLNIGIPSLRNLKHIRRQKLVLWLLLALTSLPLHLFYNSVVYVSISSNSYFAFSVSESFLENNECLNCTSPPNKSTNITDPFFPNYPYQEYPQILDGLWSRARNSTLDRLEPAECIDQYATLIQPYRRNMLLVASDESFPGREKNIFINGSDIYDAFTFASSAISTPSKSVDAYEWICSGLGIGTKDCTSRISEIRANVPAWTVGSKNCIQTLEVSSVTNLTSDIWSCSSPITTYPVSYCLSEKAPAYCKVHFNRDISILVTVINLLKAALMFYVAFRIPGEPLITMGDAVASFLAHPDFSTKDMCLLSVVDIKKRYVRPGGREWTRPKASWRHATSKTQRAVTIIMLVIALTTVSGLLRLGIYHLPPGQSRSLSGLASLRFGAVDPRAVISTIAHSADIVPKSVLANIPQLVLSILYFSYNSIFTAMLLGYEWTSYAQKRKGLRVSRTPVGEQRSSYFLQLPYRFSIPLIIIIGTLHWLVSQSIFLVSIDLYDQMDNRSAAGRSWLRQVGNLPFGDPLRITTCGYSPIAIMSVLTIGSLMLIALVGVGYLPYRRAMPLAGSCSMAISAACQSDQAIYGESSSQKLQWGVTQATRNDNGVGHCSFSASPVDSPMVGRIYA